MTGHAEMWPTTLVWLVAFPRRHTDPPPFTMALGSLDCATMVQSVPVRLGCHLGQPRTWSLISPSTMHICKCMKLNPPVDTTSTFRNIGSMLWHSQLYGSRGTMKTLSARHTGALRIQAPDILPRRLACEGSHAVEGEGAISANICVDLF